MTLSHCSLKIYQQCVATVAVASSVGNYFSYGAQLSVSKWSTTLTLDAYMKSLWHLDGYLHISQCVTFDLKIIVIGLHCGSNRLGTNMTVFCNNTVAIP